MSTENEVEKNIRFERLHRELTLAQLDTMNRIVASDPNVAKEFRRLMRKYHGEVYSLTFDPEFEEWLQKPIGAKDLRMDEDGVKIYRVRDHDYGQDRVKTSKKP